MVVRDYEEMLGVLKLDIYFELILIVGYICRDFGCFYGIMLYRYFDFFF